jgi:cytochrome c biogenesis protein CcmG/thiol:disulfide interchange protein DsbE
VSRAIIILTAVLACGPSLDAGIKLKKEAERKRAPDFELKDQKGNTLRLSDLTGKVILLDFWATWCGPCKASMPWFNDFAEQYKSEGLVVIGVSMDDQGWDVVMPFLDKMSVRYPVVIGTKRVAYLYGDVEALPLAFFIDRNHKVAAIHEGPASRKDFEKTIKLLLE